MQEMFSTLQIKLSTKSSLKDLGTTINKHLKAKAKDNVAKEKDNVPKDEL